MSDEFKELYPVIDFELCGVVIFSQRSHFIPRQGDIIEIVFQKSLYAAQEPGPEDSRVTVHKNLFVKKVRISYGFSEGRGDKEVGVTVYLSRGSAFLLPNTWESTGYSMPDTLTGELKNSGLPNDSLHKRADEEVV